MCAVHPRLDAKVVCRRKVDEYAQDLCVWRGWEQRLSRSYVRQEVPPSHLLVARQVARSGLTTDADTGGSTEWLGRVCVAGV